MASKQPMICCPHCRQMFAVTADDIGIQGRVERRYYEVIARRPHGITSEELTNIVYAEDPNGGPTSFSIVKATVFRLNQKLKPLGLKIASTKGRGARFKLQDANAA